MTQPDPLRDLPPNARDALIYLADRSREGFTGTIHVEYHGGGVRRIEHEPARVSLNPTALARYREERMS